MSPVYPRRSKFIRKSSGRSRNLVNPAPGIKSSGLFRAKISSPMSAVAPSTIDDLSQSLSRTSINSPLWTFTPHTHIIRSDVFSRFVVFDGRVDPYIEPHFPELIGPSTDDAFYSLIAARWSEYRAERYLQSSGHNVSSKLQTPETRVNTPVQLFLAYSRVSRARLEIEVYGKLLRGARPALLQEFDEIMRQSMLNASSSGALPAHCVVA